MKIIIILLLLSYNLFAVTYNLNEYKSKIENAPTITVNYNTETTSISGYPRMQTNDGNNGHHGDGNHGNGHGNGGSNNVPLSDNVTILLVFISMYCIYKMPR